MSREVDRVAIRKSCGSIFRITFFTNLSELRSKYTNVWALSIRNTLSQRECRKVSHYLKPPGSELSDHQDWNGHLHSSRSIGRADSVDSFAADPLLGVGPA